ncbi:MAG: hypothetical protein KDD60_03395 [Bdellovibrionales bacterium]|nr:hypothetical protein [Bdellovibrionales bacterium]
MPPKNIPFELRKDGFSASLEECDLIISPYRYEGKIQELIQEAKFHGNYTAATTVVHLAISALSPLLETSAWDYIIPVPPRMGQAIHRGLHLPTQLAEAVSCFTRGKTLSPTERTTLIWKPRLFPLRSQHHLTQDHRLKNLRNQLLLLPWSRCIRNKSILIVDDVASTGATLRECSLTISRRFPVRVDALVLAYS